jgi:hypothetical protein
MTKGLPRQCPSLRNRKPDKRWIENFGADQLPKSRHCASAVSWSWGEPGMICRVLPDLNRCIQQALSPQTWRRLGHGPGSMSLESVKYVWIQATRVQPLQLYQRNGQNYKDVKLKLLSKSPPAPSPQQRASSERGNDVPRRKQVGHACRSLLE